MEDESTNNSGQVLFYTALEDMAAFFVSDKPNENTLERICQSTFDHKFPMKNCIIRLDEF